MEKPVDVEAKKRAAYREWIVKTERKERTRRERRCYWTRPFGHHYLYDEAYGFRIRCAGCEKKPADYWSPK